VTVKTLEVDRVVYHHFKKEFDQWRRVANGPSAIFLFLFLWVGPAHKLFSACVNLANIHGSWIMIFFNYE
jgi:hypothetical protein